MKTIEEIIGENIRLRRKALNMTQDELGKASKLTVQSLSRIEKGKRPARRANLEAIAKALGCSREDLQQSVVENGITPDLQEVVNNWHKLRKGTKEVIMMIVRNEVIEAAQKKA